MNWLALPFMSQIVAFIDSSKYILFFLGTFTEGPLVMMSGGFLYRLGQVAFWPTYLAMVFGDFTSDLGLYLVGYWAARPFFNRYGHYFNITPAVIEKIERRFRQYSDRVLVVSKLTMGFGLSFATLMTAGMLRVSFWRYAAINLACGFIWTLFLFGVGYFFGNVYQLIPGYWKIIFPICSLAVLFFVIRSINSRLARTEW